MMTDKTQETRRALFEQAVIKRMKEGGFLEVEIRVECLSIGTDDAYHDSSVDTYWHYFNAALDAVEIDLPGLTGTDQPFTGTPISEIRAQNHYNRAVGQCRAAIESTNLGIKIK